ncbi:unnamed protein product [Colias eurytheme]|nr:unnamed protein product [Colias eurytheme]
MIHLSSPAGQSVAGRRNERRYPSRSHASCPRCALSFAPRARSTVSTNRRPSFAPPRAERQCVLSSQGDDISPREVVVPAEDAHMQRDAIIYPKVP